MIFFYNKILGQMGLIISTEEKNALIQCQSDIRYKYTLKRIADTETLWSIVENEDTFSIQYHGKMKLFPIWSAKEYTQDFCVNERKDCQSIAIDLDCFENSVIDFICEKGLYINVFLCRKDPFGQIVSLNKFAEDLSILLEDYE